MDKMDEKLENISIELESIERNKKRNLDCLRSFIYMLIRKIWCRTLGPHSTSCTILQYSKKKVGKQVN